MSDSLNLVKELRKERGWSQEELSVRSGVSVGAIRGIEKGGRCLQDTKRRILRAFGLGMCDKDNVFPSSPAVV